MEVSIRPGHALEVWQRFKPWKWCTWNMKNHLALLCNQSSHVSILQGFIAHTSRWSTSLAQMCPKKAFPFLVRTSSPWCLFSDKKLHWIPLRTQSKTLKFHSFTSKNACVSSENVWKFTEQAPFFYRGILRKLYFNLNIEPASTKSLADLQVFVSVCSLCIRHKSTWPTKGKRWNPSLVFLVFFRKSRSLIWLKNWRNVVDRFPPNLVFFIQFTTTRLKKSALLFFIFGGFPTGFPPPPKRKTWTTYQGLQGNPKGGSVD